MSITSTEDLIRIFNKNNEKIKTINRDLTLVRYGVSDMFFVFALLLGSITAYVATEYQAIL